MLSCREFRLLSGPLEVFFYFNLHCQIESVVLFIVHPLLRNIQTHTRKLTAGFHQVKKSGKEVRKVVKNVLGINQ